MVSQAEERVIRAETEAESRIERRAEEKAGHTIAKVEAEAAQDVAEANRLVNASIHDAMRAAQAEGREQHARSQQSIRLAQEQALSRVAAVRKEAGKWVQNANDEARAARAAAVAAEAEAEAWKARASEKVSQAVAKTQVRAATMYRM